MAARRWAPLAGAAVVVAAAVGVVAVAAANRSPSVSVEPSPQATTTTRAVSISPPTTAATVEPSSCPTVPQAPLGPPRTCTVLTPPAPGSAKLPVVVVLHGFSSNPSMVIGNGAWEAAVREHGFIAVVPGGVGDSWNAGACCPLATTLGVDDATYLSQLIAAVRTRPDVDPDRVFIAGESNGGMMAYRFACTHSAEVAGIASVAGTNVSGCTPATPIPVLHVHGTADLAVPYQGGQSPISFLLGVYFASVPSATQAIAEAQGCDPIPQRSTQGTVTRSRWSGCRDGVSVILDTIDGQSHDWPRSDRYDATTEVLRFFGIIR